MRDPRTNQQITIEALLARSIAHIETCLAYQSTKRFWDVLTAEQQTRALRDKTRDLINAAPAAVQPQLRRLFLLKLAD